MTYKIITNHIRNSLPYLILWTISSLPHWINTWVSNSIICILTRLWYRCNFIVSSPITRPISSIHLCKLLTLWYLTVIIHNSPSIHTLSTCWLIFQYISCYLYRSSFIYIYRYLLCAIPLKEVHLCTWTNPCIFVIYHVNWLLNIELRIICV